MKISTLLELSFPKRKMHIKNIYLTISFKTKVKGPVKVDYYENFSQTNPLRNYRIILCSYHIIETKAA